MPGGLYMNPPDAAVVLCVDHKSQIQALDRTAPILPLLPGTPQRLTHHYKRNGTTNLGAALDTASGRVITSMTRRNRTQEFQKLLNLINREVSPRTRRPRRIGQRIAPQNRAIFATTRYEALRRGSEKDFKSEAGVGRLVPRPPGTVIVGAPTGGLGEC